MEANIESKSAKPIYLTIARIAAIAVAISVACYLVARAQSGSVGEPAADALEREVPNGMLHSSKSLVINGNEAFVPLPEQVDGALSSSKSLVLPKEAISEPWGGGGPGIFMSSSKSGMPVLAPDRAKKSKASDTKN